MSEGWLRVNNLGKAYRHYASEWHRVGSWFGIPATPKDEQWVLRNVSFNVEPGEAVGIVGQNGAGKSTLLKLITGTLKPNEGHVEISGRVAAILELGMGFNHEFTGRQNASHALGLMGFSVAEIAEVMPQIESFAEVGEYFDQPVRTYSSGMQMRVAFATVSAYQPEFLIVDEALSVGDTYFQHKSFARIRQFKELGTTLLFVTHGMGDIRMLCDRVVLLDKGQVIRDGLPDEVVDYYNALMAEKENAILSVVQQRQKNGWNLTKSGSGEATLTTFRLTDAESNQELTLVRVGQAVVLKAIVSINKGIPRLVVGYMLRDRIGHVVWGTNTWYTKQSLQELREGQEVQYELDFVCSLGPGSYSFTLALCSTDDHLLANYEWTDNALVFDVVNADRPTFVGSSYIEAGIRVKELKL